MGLKKATQWDAEGGRVFEGNLRNHNLRRWMRIKDKEDAT